MTIPPPPAPPSDPHQGDGVASSLISPGLTSSLHGAATTFGSPRGGFGSAFQSPGVASASGYNMSARSPVPTPGDVPGTPLTARGDRRSKMVRERSRSVSAFASSAGGRPGPLTTAGGMGTRSTPAAAAETATDGKIAEEEPGEQIPALFASFCYRGMEVIFAAVHDQCPTEDGAPACHLLGIHARTRAPFQKCHLDGPYGSSPKASAPNRSKSTVKKSGARVEIVHLAAHPSTGYIFAADNMGCVHSFYPTRADPMVEAYGKFRWRPGAVADAREVFGYEPLCAMLPHLPTLSATDDGFEVEAEGGDTTEDGEPAPKEGESTDAVPCFFRRRRSSHHIPGPPGGPASPGNSPGSGANLPSNYPLNDGQPPLPKGSACDDDMAEYGVTIRASMTQSRVLVMHRDQLAVFDFSLPSEGPRTPSGVPPPTAFQSFGHDSGKATRLPEAPLLWTHKLQGSIIDHCSLSGDGCAIAVALRGEGVGVPYPFGVRTFVRDREDGSGVSASGGPAGDDKSTLTPKSSGKPPIHRRTGSRSPLPKKNTENVSKKEDAEKLPKGAKETIDSAAVTPKQTPPAKQGILYKPGQFLVHSAPVTRLSFRGYGTNTSSAQHNSGTLDDDCEGNDLLLTTCSSDCSLRIFSQNSWRQLMHWNSPPRSRADWVRGISAANLGDLDSDPAMSERASKKQKKGQGDEGQLTPIPKAVDPSSPYHPSQQPNSPQPTLSRHNSMATEGGSSVMTEDSGGINRALLAGHHRQSVMPRSPFPQQSVPGTHAGAWIAELTFRNSFPALRLSRLSYMKTGGDDALPAHFESVAAILPPGSLAEEVVLEDDVDGMEGIGGYQMEVEGIWPVWDPWEPDAKGGAGRPVSSPRGRGGVNGADGAPSNPLGSPQATPAAAMTPRWLGDGLSDLGGSHLPPSELRITSPSFHGSSQSSSSSSLRCLTQIEMPLWGDKDLGAMEFGSPLRYCMMLPKEDLSSLGQEVPSATLDYESGSLLCAKSSDDLRSIDLCWRRHGAVNMEETTNIFDGSGAESAGGGVIRRFQDLSLVPLSLSLPSLTLPGHQSTHAPSPKESMQCISTLHWWPDENYGGPPRLAVLTSGGTIIVYEMPPPWSALEPPMPAYDPFDDDESRGSSVDDFDMFDDDGSLPPVLNEGAMEGVGEAGSFNDSDSLQASRPAAEYEVSIVPHPDFGLGLRLEAQAVGMPAIAGTFKKHPLSGGRLPAERSGVIALGDELLAVNDALLEGMRFEEAIATVRQIGFDSHGAPLKMRFRRGRGKRRGGTTVGSASLGSRTGGHVARGSASSNAADSKGLAGDGPSLGRVGSFATVEVGADAEIQQGFGRVIALVRNAIVGGAQQATPPAMLLLPWNFGKGASVTTKMYGGALILWAVADQIKAARLEAVLDMDPENAQFIELGSVTLDLGAKKSSVKSISFVSSTEKGWLVAIQDCSGNVSLLFVETSSTTTSTSAMLRAEFRHYPCVFNHDGKSDELGSKHDPRDSPFILRSFSLELFGGMAKCDGGCKELKIWSALPGAMQQGDDSQVHFEYESVTVSTGDNPHLPSEDTVLDFQWISSGYVDAFPWLVIFTQSAAVVYHRSGLQMKWRPAAMLSYNERCPRGSNLPQDNYPHLVTALRALELSDDEQSTMKSDWNPESILAAICTEESGAKLALSSYVCALYRWLSRWMTEDDSVRPNWDGIGTLSNAPFRIVTSKTVLTNEEVRDEGPGETSANLMAAMSLTSSTKPQSEEEGLLSELQSALRPTGSTASSSQAKKLNGTRHSREFMLAMSYGRSKKETNSREKGEGKPLPIPLQTLNESQLLCLWAIGDIVSNPPAFKKLDPLSQHCLFCVALMRRLLDDQVAVSKKDSIESPGSMPEYEGGRPTMMLSRHSSSNDFGQQKVNFNTIASSALLSALMSNEQGKVLSSCRLKGEKFDWETARATGLPYWIRSDKVLLSIADEIAATAYKSTKSVMDCALYYAAARNFKKLRTIAATDRSEQGKKFLKFIIDHDFSSDRGRKSAEKNAYSLLRKRKYKEAASFFLLAEPPMIKTALDVIRLQLKDGALAFFVARLVESAPKSSSAPGGGGLTIGGGFNLGSMGGGGGFASGSSDHNVGADSLAQEDEGTVKFDCWRPDLGRSARSVLLTKDSSTDASTEDVCFEALKLLWLERPNEATLRLSHMPPRASDDAGKESASYQDVAFPSALCDDDKENSTNASVLKAANAIIDFCSGPSLLKRMKPKKRVLWTSALLVSRALGRCGIENPSMHILLQVADPAYDEEEVGTTPPHSGPPNDTQPQVPSTSAPSSIFDSFDAAPPKPKPKQVATPSQPASSIFDSFDAAPPKPMPAMPQQAQSDSMASSIFDSFDAAPPRPQPTAPKPTPSDPMSSSIFDSFDAAPAKPKQVPPKPPSDPMASSIFDSFDAAPPKPKPAAPKPSPADSMSSSIFDSFDTAPQKQPQKLREGSTSEVGPSAAAAQHEEEKEQPLNIPACPQLWDEWRQSLIHVIAARRFLRELARIITSFDGEIASDATDMDDFAQHNHPIVPAGAAEVLHNACDSDGLLNSIYKSLAELSSSFGVEESVMIEQALKLVSASRHPKRLVSAVILHCLLGRGDLAEDLVRDSASFQTNGCEFNGFSNDTIVDSRDTRYYTSSLWARRHSSSMIWQLELCLWLYRGGVFDMSSAAAKETLLAVRIGLAVAAWGRCHHSLETLTKAEPDCLMDFDSGRNLWRSMKVIAYQEETATNGIDGVTSGGWEFLVDCRREEATEMLRDGRTGQFLIRPHPQDPGVFTLSFKTNLVPTESAPTKNYEDSTSDSGKPQEEASASAAPAASPSSTPKKVVKRDDVVQHAIIRLSDSGFRCGSFGPFATLVKLLHTVSDSLPFDLRFGDPPVKGIISERGTQTSPNSFLFRKMALHSKAQFFQFQSSRNKMKVEDADECLDHHLDAGLHRRFGLFSALMFLTDLRKQLCAVAAAVDEEPSGGAVALPEDDEADKSFPNVAMDDDDFDGSLTEGTLEEDDEEALGVASRMVKPLLNWVRSREIDIVDEVTPMIRHEIISSTSTDEISKAFEALGDSFEVPSKTTSGDSVVRRMIQSGSGVDFRTLRVGEAGNSVIVVLFGKQDAIKWLMANETGNDEAEAKSQLKLMELMRIIEPITSADLSIPKSYAASHPATESRYRFVDPWEVEALESRSGETASASLGRGRYQTLNVGLVANACERIVRAAGGLHLMGLWSTMKGGITLTKALCSAHPSWERDAGGDLLMKRGFLMEPSPYDNSIRQHLYGNYLFRRLELPQRFLALLQVELLDLKNVTSPSGSSSLSAYALLRLKRQGSSAPLNHKARSLDSACTQPRKISKSSGPNAPASWGSLVRFRFPLPENVNCEGRSFDKDRESLFKGPPTCLQITVYEKKFMSDIELGGADVNLESLGSGGQIEEWVPLKGKDGITWFARIRLSLRFELLCLDPSLDASESSKGEPRCPSVGLKKIQKLSRLGAHEDQKSPSRSSSTPDIFGYFQVY
ncbi:hypothetical protein ACHAXT_013183 [Thalassiosira profunda]